MLLTILIDYSTANWVVKEFVGGKDEQEVEIACDFAEER